MEQERPDSESGLGNRLMSLRAAKKMSQADVAEALAAIAPTQRVTQAQVSNWEKGKRTPRFQTSTALAQVFGVSANWLRGGTGDSVPLATDPRRADGEPDAIAIETHIAIATTAQKLREEKARAEGRVSVLGRMGATEEVEMTHKAMARFSLAIKVLEDLLAEYGTNPIGGAW